MARGPGAVAPSTSSALSRVSSTTFSPSIASTTSSSGAPTTPWKVWRGSNATWPARSRSRIRSTSPLWSRGWLTRTSAVRSAGDAVAQRAPLRTGPIAECETACAVASPWSRPCRSRSERIDAGDHHAEDGDRHEGHDDVEREEPQPGSLAVHPRAIDGPAGLLDGATARNSGESSGRGQQERGPEERQPDSVDPLQHHGMGADRDPARPGTTAESTSRRRWRRPSSRCARARRGPACRGRAMTAATAREVAKDSLSESRSTTTKSGASRNPPLFASRPETRPTVPATRARRVRAGRRSEYLVRGRPGGARTGGPAP